jgi:hypothetical protein
VSEAEPAVVQVLTYHDTDVTDDPASEGPVLTAIRKSLFGPGANPTALKAPLLDGAGSSSGSAAGDLTRPSALEIGLTRSVEEEAELRALVKRGRDTPWHKALSLLACFVGVVLLNLVKGDGIGKGLGGITCGSAGYVVITVLTVPWVMGYFFWARRLVLREYQTKERLGYT